MGYEGVNCIGIFLFCTASLLCHWILLISLSNIGKYWFHCTACWVLMCWFHKSPCHNFFFHKPQNYVFFQCTYRFFWLYFLLIMLLLVLSHHTWTPQWTHRLFGDIWKWRISSMFSLSYFLLQGKVLLSLVRRGSNMIATWSACFVRSSSYKDYLQFEDKWLRNKHIKCQKCTTTHS